MKVLVILAAYNGEKYIKKQIDTILAQKNVDLFLLIFDDGSKDETISIISAINYDKSRIKLVRNKIPTKSAAINFLDAIKGLDEFEFNNYDYISFSDQDDIWLPNKLHSAIEMIQGERSDLYMSNLILWDEKSNKKSIINKAYPQKKYDYLFEGGSAGCTYIFSNTLGIALKKKLEQIDYSKWIFFSHDWFIYFFARVNSYKVSIDENAYIVYRIHANNLHGHLNSNSFLAFKNRIILIRNGWYFKQANEFIKFFDSNSVEYKIYKSYSRNYFTRLYILLRYNFALIRSRKKFLKFFVLSLIPFMAKKNV